MVRIDLTPQSTSQTAGDNHLATANTCNWKECNYICTGVQLMIVGNCELRNAARQKNPTKSIYASAGSGETTLGTSVSDTRDGVRLGSARN